MHSTLHRLGFDVVRRRPDGSRDHSPPYPPDFDEFDRDTLERVAAYTLTSPERVVALIDAVEYVNRAEIPGAVVECGVWKGGSMMAAAFTLLRLGDHRDLFLYDTFEGMTEPTQHDVDYEGRLASDLMRERPSSTWGDAALDSVRKALASTGYPAPLMHFVAGPVEETIPSTMPEQISVLRLDTDWYESTRHELEHLYPRLMPGGVLIIDDYGHFLGARKATDDYFAQHAEPVLFSRIDYTCRMAVKR